MSGVNNLLSSLLENNKKISVHTNKFSSELNKNIESLTDAQIKEFRMSMPSYMRSPFSLDTDKTQYFVMSYLNRSNEQALNTTMTANIGYLFKCLFEYKTPRDNQLCGIDVTKPLPDKTKAIVDSDPALQKIIEEKRIINEFLKSIYSYDPNRHFQHGIKTNVADPKRVVYDTPEVRKQFVNNIKHEDYEILQIQPGKPTKFCKAFYDTIPSNDTIYDINRYFNDNQEKIIEISNSLYGGNSSIDLCVNVHCGFDSHKDAIKFISENGDLAVLPLHILEGNKMTILTSTHENRERSEVIANRENFQFKELTNTLYKNNNLVKERLKKTERKQRALLKENKDAEGIREMDSFIGDHKSLMGETYTINDDIPSNGMSDTRPMQVLDMLTGETHVLDIATGGQQYDFTDKTS